MWDRFAEYRDPCRATPTAALHLFDGVRTTWRHHVVKEGTGTIVTYYVRRITVATVVTASILTRVV